MPKSLDTKLSMIEKTSFLVAFRFENEMFNAVYSCTGDSGGGGQGLELGAHGRDIPSTGGGCTNTDELVEL